jgi:hypothetical protein
MTEAGGVDGTPLPSGDNVFRLTFKPKDYPQDKKVLPISFADSFTCSTEEKNDPPPRLSVFAESLTTHLQGWQLTNRKYQLVLLLQTDGIRALRLECENAELDVVWHRIESALAGARGHAGITGLQVGNKVARRFLRMKLADISTPEELLFAYIEGSEKPAAKGE